MRYIAIAATVLLGCKTTEPPMAPTRTGKAVRLQGSPDAYPFQCTKAVNYLVDMEHCARTAESCEDFRARVAGEYEMSDCYPQTRAACFDIVMKLYDKFSESCHVDFSACKSAHLAFRTGYEDDVSVLNECEAR